MSGSNRDFLNVALRNFGIAKQAVSDYTAVFSPELCDALADFIKLSSQRTAFLQKAFFEPDRMHRLNCTCPQLDAYPDVGYVKTKIDLDGGASLFQINEGYCRMMTAHPEELMSRLQQNDLILPFSDLDQICNIIDGLACTVSQESHVTCDPIVFNRYYAMTRGFSRSGDAVLCRVTCRITFDSRGNHDAIEKFVAPIAAHEYDLYRHLTPHLCRPLASAIGDARGGRQLLEEYSRDRMRSIVEVGRTEQGERAMGHLAEHVRSLCDELRQSAPSSSAPSAAAATADSSSAACSVRGAHALAHSERTGAGTAPSRTDAAAHAADGAEHNGALEAERAEEGRSDAEARRSPDGDFLSELLDIEDDWLGASGGGGGAGLLAEMWNAEAAGLLDPAPSEPREHGSEEEEWRLSPCTPCAWLAEL